MGSRTFKFRTYMLDSFDSISFDKEMFLEEVIEHSGLTPEEFVVDHIIEEYPIEIYKTDSLDDDNYQFTIKQNFCIRLKTEEERQLEIEAVQEKEKNVDTDES